MVLKKEATIATSTEPKSDRTTLEVEKSIITIDKGTTEPTTIGMEETSSLGPNTEKAIPNKTTAKPSISSLMTTQVSETGTESATTSIQESSERPTRNSSESTPEFVKPILTTQSSEVYRSTTQPTTSTFDEGTATAAATSSESTMISSTESHVVYNSQSFTSSKIEETSAFSRVTTEKETPKVLSNTGSNVRLETEHTTTSKYTSKTPKSESTSTEFITYLPTESTRFTTEKVSHNLTRNCNNFKYRIEYSVCVPIVGPLMENRHFLQT